MLLCYTIRKEPETIFIHTGTNHFDWTDFDMDKIETDYVDTVFSINRQGNFSKKLAHRVTFDFLMEMCI